MMHQIVAGFMVAEAIVFGVIAYVMFRKKKAKLERCYRTCGDVIDVKTRGGGEGGPTKHPVIRYKTQNGEEVTFESKFGSSSWAVKVGDRLEILANQQNPADAEIVGFMAQWALILILAILSGFSLLGAPVAYFIMK